MDDLDKPPIGADVFESIAVEQYEIHKTYLQQLRVMQVIALDFMDGSPPTPKQPLRLFRILNSYVHALFDVEAKHYPEHVKLASWLTGLASRIEEQVMVRIAEVDRRSLAKLEHHATRDQMRAAIRVALQTHVKPYLEPPNAIAIPLASQRLVTDDITPGKPKSLGKGRLRGTITSPIAARRMEAFIEATGKGQTEFAVSAGTTDRTLRAFRKKGRVRRDIFDGIAKAMGLTREQLMTPED